MQRFRSFGVFWKLFSKTMWRHKTPFLVQKKCNPIFRPIHSRIHYHIDQSRGILTIWHILQICQICHICHMVKNTMAVVNMGVIQITVKCFYTFCIFWPPLPSQTTISNKQEEPIVLEMHYKLEDICDTKGHICKRYMKKSFPNANLMLCQNSM